MFSQRLLYKTSDLDSKRNFSSHSFLLASIHHYFSHQKLFCRYSKVFYPFGLRLNIFDGSFDEFYPFERLRSALLLYYTLYSNIEAYKLISEEFNIKEKQIFIAVRKAASYIALGDKEGDDLANHRVMAYLSLIKSYEILQDEWLYKKALEAFNNYLKYNIFDEGWSIEYDGIDPGYLSASYLSFRKHWRL